MFPEENVKIEELSADRGRTHFNYGIINGRGIAYIFNFLRYNSAFLVRNEDCEKLREAAQKYGDWINKPFQVVVCRYSFAGKTRPGWADGPLPADCEFEPQNDPMDLMNLGCDQYELRPPKKLKVQHIATSEGTVRWQFQNMYDNKAFPHREEDANALERAIQWEFTTGKMEPFTIELSNFKMTKTSWIWPPKPTEATT
tara:strand:+ start:94 stop:690 length:597 start_codon:yes stop_codon:yes gene_type:complete